MYQYLLITSLLIFSCLGLPKLDGRIVGGQDANIENYPYMLSLERDEIHNCGASIISNVWAVTAAHCVKGEQIERLRFRAGSSVRQVGGTLHPADQVIMHPDYDDFVNYDIAVVKVSVPFVYGPGVRPIELATEDPATSDVGVVTGWGFTIPDETSMSTQLQSLQVSIVDYQRCKEIYTYTLTKKMICAVYEAGRGFCNTDSGGPLAVAGKLVGLVSFSQGCGDAEKPGVYTDVPSLRDFVLSNTDL